MHLATAEAAWVEFVAPLRPLAVIDELQLTVEVFSSRPGARLIAEVVLPYTLDSRSGEPRRVRVFGPSCTQVGAWQALTLAELPDQVAQSVRNLQITTSEPVDSRGAYVDRLRLRVRPGQGETTLRLRPPQYRGGVYVKRADGAPAPVWDGAVLPVSGQFVSRTGQGRPSRDAPLQVALSGGVLHISGKAIFPRAIDHVGGPLGYARDLGCNIVVLSSPPTRAQEREAEAADLWLIAPPPDPQILLTEGKMADFPRVIVWHLGSRLSTADLEATSRWAGLVRRFDPARGRPIAASVRFGHRALSRMLDIVVIERRPPEGPWALERFVERLQAERRLVQPGKTLWMGIQTRRPEKVVQQARRLVPGNSASLETRVRADQISRLTWIALAHGMKGVIFGAPATSIADDAEHPTIIELELINSQLDLLGSLLVGTGTTSRVAELARDLRAGVLSNGRTHCVLPWHHGDPQEPLTRPGSAQNAAAPPYMPLVVPGVAEPSDAFLLTTTGAHRVTARREAGGVRITAGPILPRDIILLSQDALATQRLREQVTKQARRTVDLERALLRADAGTRGSADSMPGPRVTMQGAEAGGAPSSQDQAPQGLPEARWSTGRATTSRDEAKVRNLRLSLARSRRHIEGFSAHEPLRSIALDRFPELARFSEFYRLLDRRPLPTPNLLPAGGFEGLDVARQAGWRHVQLAQKATHNVELVSIDAHNGAFCLRVFRDPGPDASGNDLFATVWMRSPVVPLRAGDVIRITGWVRSSADNTSTQPTHAVVEDTLGGEALSLDLVPDAQWRPFVMYRATDKHHQWSVRLSCSGPGDVFFDDLAVQRVPPQVVARSWRNGRVGR